MRPVQRIKEEGGEVQWTHNQKKSPLNTYIILKKVKHNQEFKIFIRTLRRDHDKWIKR